MPITPKVMAGASYGPCRPVRHRGIEREAMQALSRLRGESPRRMSGEGFAEARGRQQID
ncbi:hypothetical protein AB0L17_35750 [Streptomyces cellulosae]